MATISDEAAELMYEIMTEELRFWVFSTEPTAMKHAIATAQLGQAIGRTFDYFIAHDNSRQRFVVVERRNKL